MTPTKTALEAFEQWLDDPEERDRQLTKAETALVNSQDVIRKALTANAWRDIKDAPMDGSVVMLYRKATTVGRANQIIFGAYDKESRLWVWPDSTFNPYEEGKFHAQLKDGLFCSDEFTCWQPLLEQPPC